MNYKAPSHPSSGLSPIGLGLTFSGSPTCPQDQGAELFDRLVELRDNRYWNISKFCRQAITEKLERMELLK